MLACRSGQLSRAQSGRMRTADLPQDLQQSQAPAAQRLRGWVASLSEPVPLKYVLSGAALLLIITLQV